MYPTARDPSYGAFVAAQMEGVARNGAHVEVEFIDGRAGASRYAMAIGRIRRLTRAGRFDVIHAHYGLSGFVAGFQALPLVVSFCGDDLLGTPTGRGGITTGSAGLRWLSRRAARRADAIICKSQELRAALPHLEDRARAHVIPNGVDTDRFNPGDRADARRRLGLSLGERLVLFPHTPDVPRKRFDLAEAAVAALAQEGVAVRLWTVTGIPHAQMPDHYRAADCLLLTSDQEGSPNVVKEALCCDVPVVAVDVGDVRRWVDPTAGCYVVERDPSAIAAALRRVLCAERRVDGSAVRAELSAGRVAQQLLEVYREAIARRA